MGLKSAGKWYTIHKNVDRERDRIELKRARKGARKRMGGGVYGLNCFEF